MKLWQKNPSDTPTVVLTDGKIAAAIEGWSDLRPANIVERFGPENPLLSIGRLRPLRRAAPQKTGNLFPDGNGKVRQIEFLA